MRLLKLQSGGDFSLVERVGRNIPPYAILSHTWGDNDEEVTFKDLLEDKGEEKAGYAKLKFCAKQAAQDGLEYFWVDTACIDKSSSAELSEAINSMFCWYQNAVKCYAYLSDVSTTGRARSVPFPNSRWFTRGWTLQELLAPRSVEFFSMEGDLLGDKVTLTHEVATTTGIPVDALRGHRPVSQFGVEERMLWAAKRETTREEDSAYSLLGIFDIHLPLIYGEGRKNALRRLQKEVEEGSRTTAPAFPQAVQHRNTIQEAKSTYYIPFRKNRYFVGRSEELGELKQRLITDQDCQMMSIVGLGGTGKTQVALQFAYMVKESCPEFSIFWLSALSMESFEQACADIALALNLVQDAGKEEDAKLLLKRHLSSEQAGRWLVVLDNADDTELLFGSGQSKSIVDYLPESSHGSVVVTTRTLEVAVSLTRGDAIELGPMGRQDAIKFLEKSLIRKGNSRDSMATKDLLDELTCLPLAIAQAAAYLNMNRMSIANYLRLLRNTEHDIVSIMSKEFRDHTRYRDSANAVATTWVVSFRQIQERDPIAAEVLSFLSCIEWKVVPRSLLPVVQPEALEQAIGTLCGYSFLARRDDKYQESERGEEWYDMHRLVHLASRIWVNRHCYTAEATEKAMRHVTSIFPSHKYENREIWREYLPHAIRLLENTQDQNVGEKAELCLLVALCLRIDGRIGETVRWLQESCRLKYKLDERDSTRLLSQHELAVAYKANGQVKQAMELLEHVVAVQEQVLAEEHPSRLASLHVLANAYEADGQVKRAVELLEHVVAVQEQVLAEEHPDRLASLHVLANAYEADGQIKRAVKLLEYVVVVKERVLAEEHPSRLASLHALANAYEADGQVKRAVELLEHVVVGEEQVLAEEHPDRLASEHELAHAYMADGQVQRAIELLEHVVTVEARIFRDDHPSRLTSVQLLEVCNAKLRDDH